MKRTILILDDSPLMGKFLIRLFQDRYEVLHCSDPLEALDWLQQGLRPHLVLLDYEMENMNGIEWISALKYGAALWGQIPVMMLSGSKDAALRIQAFERGANDFVLKPFHPKELQLRVERSFQVPIAAAL